MHVVRFQLAGQPAIGVVRDGVIYEAQGDPFDRLTEGTAVGPLEEAMLYPPVQPSKIIAIGLNYLDHITEDAPGFATPENPIIFLKPPSSLLGHNGSIVLPTGAENVDAEAELAVVIGRRARHVRASEVNDYILGYTCSNDVSARDYQFKDGQWARAKGFDTFTPVGRAIATDITADNLRITCRLNGEVRQQSSTSQLLFGVPILVEFVTRVMTLEPGDLIMTGTPEGVGAVTRGDRMHGEIAGLGALDVAVR